MKIKIRPYYWILLKENILYLVSIILLSSLSIFFLIKNLPQLAQLQEEVSNLTQEVNQLKIKLKLIDSLVADHSNINLDEDIKFINTLIPSEEDYFSILYALEQLSSKTGFFITSYTVDMKKSNVNKLRLTVKGTGNVDTFMNFLKEYNFGGGRLITSDKIELSQDLTGEININLTFYNKNVAHEQGAISKKTIQSLSAIKELKNKVQFSFQESSPETNFDYPRKTNPF